MVVMLLAVADAAAQSVPTAPRNLTATVNINAYVDLAWDLPATTNGTITHYIIEYRESGSWTELIDTSTRPSALRATRTWVDSTVTINVARSYRVKAVNANGTGPASNVVTVTPDFPPLELQSATHDDDTIQVDLNSFIDRTIVPDKSAFLIKVNGVSRATKAIDYPSAMFNLFFLLETTGVFRPGDRVILSYRAPASSPVTGLNGKELVEFTDFLVTNNLANTSPAAPPGFRVTPGVAAGSMSLSWGEAWHNGSPISRYEVRIGTGSWTTVAGGANARQYTASGLVLNTEYEFKVRAVNPLGNGAVSTVKATVAESKLAFRLSMNRWGIHRGGGPTKVTLGFTGHHRAYPLTEAITFDLTWNGQPVNEAPLHPDNPTSITIPAGKVQASVELRAAADSDGADKVYNVRVKHPLVATSREGGVFTVQNSDGIAVHDNEEKPAASLTASRTTVDEGGSFDLTVSLAHRIDRGVSMPLKVNNPNRRPLGTVPANITVPANQLSATVTIATVDTADKDGDHKLTFFIYRDRDDPFLFASNNAAVTVRDVTPAGTATIRAITNAASESGDPNKNARLNIGVILSKPVNQTVTVDYRTADGGAIAGTDYIAQSGTLTFAPNEVRKDVNVEILEDGVGDHREKFRLWLENPTGPAVLTQFYWAIGTIYDEKPTFITYDASAHESGDGTDSSMSFKVHLLNAAAATVKVDYATADGSARAGSDYTARSGTLTFEPGGASSQIVTVPVKDDAVEDSGETFSLRLSNPQGGAQLHVSRSRATGTILNEEAEGVAASFPASQSTSASHSGSEDRPQVIVAFSEAVASVAADTPSMAVTGATVSSVQTHAEDGLENAWAFTLAPDGDGDVTFALVADAACALGGICTAAGTVLTQVPAALTISGPAVSDEEDDSEPNAQEVSIAAGTSPVTEGTEAVFTLSRSGASTEEALTVTVDVSESGAMLAGTAPTEVTFAAGAETDTLTVATADDEAAEAASAVTVTVVAGDGYGVAANGTAATVTVADDDAAPVVTTAAALAAPENGTAVATLAATDADTAETELQWTIAGGADAAAFKLSGGGVLAFAAAKDYEAPDDADTDGVYAVTVQVTDGANPVEAALTVSLTDVYEPVPAGTVWSAKMTVVAYGTGAVGAGTADLFANQVGSANLRAKWLWYQPSERKLRLAFDAGLTDAEALTLHLGETTLSFPENSGGNSSFSWEDVDIAWTDGQTLAVRVMDPSAEAAGADETVTDDSAAPELSSATVNETVLTLAWSEPLDAASQPAAGAFTVTVGTAGRTVSGVAVSGSAVTLTLASVVAADETVTVGYTVPADAEAARIEDAAGNAAAGFAAQAVTNETAGPPVPELSVGEAAAQAGQFGVRIAFAEAVTGLAVEDLGAERVGGSAAAVSELTEAETGRVWTATVAAAEAGRYLVRLAAGAVQAGARQSLASVLAVDVDAQGNAEAVGGPVVTSVALALDGSWTDGDTVRLALAFSEPVTVGTAAGTPSVGIALDGAARSAAYASGTGTTSLAFAYEVTSDDGTVAAVAVTADSLAVNGGTIRDAAGRDADLAHAGIGTVPAVEDSEAAAEDSEAAVDPDALTASFEGVPEAHDGSSPFTFRVRFSLEPRVSFRVLRDESFAVTGGEVDKARRVDGRNDLGEIHIEPEGWDDVTVALGGGRACGTEGAICTAGGKVLANTAVAVVPGPLALSVADVRVVEGAQAVLAFPVTLNRAASGTVTADYATADGTATAGADYTAASGTLTFQAGETEKTVAVAVLDDAHDDGEETLTLELSNASGARIRDAEATGTIANSDPLARAWLARFGRTAAGHVLDAVSERLAGTRRDPRMTVAGRRPGAAPAAPTAAYHDPLQRGDEPRTLQLAELVDGSSFTLLAATGSGADALEDGAGDGGRWSVWGRGGWSRFEGTQGELSLDGDVITATVGADYERDRLLGGLAVAYSSGDGTFDHAASGDSGSLRTVLLGVYPYVRLALHERLAVWGLFGYAVHGELTLDGKETEPIDTGAGMLMGAFGARGTLLAAAPGGGFELAAEADGLVLRMRSEEADGLAATTAEVERLRLTLTGSYRNLPLLGGVLTPALEVGGRYDGGDAETGAGLLVGGSLRYAVPAWGLTVAGSGQGLLLHETGGFAEWGAGGSLQFSPWPDGRGPSLRVARSWGATATSARGLWALPDASRLPAGDHFDPGGGQLDAEFSYGLAALAGAATVTPYAGLTMADGTRAWSLGARLRHEPSLSLSLEGTRREPAAAAEPEHTLELRAALRH